MQPASAANQPTTLAPDIGTGSRRAVVFGDSLAYAAADDYVRLTARALRTSVNAFPGAHLANWIKAVPVAARQAPTAVVLALGTNDAIGWAKGSYDPVPYWTGALDALAGQCVVIVRPRDYDLARTVGRLWDRLVPVIAAHPNVQVYEWWTTMTATRPDLTGPDGVHSTPYGELVYGWALFMAQLQCPAR